MSGQDGRSRFESSCSALRLLPANTHLPTVEIAKTWLTRSQANRKWNRGPALDGKDEAGSWLVGGPGKPAPDPIEMSMTGAARKDLFGFGPADVDRVDIVGIRDFDDCRRLAGGFEASLYHWTASSGREPPRRRGNSGCEKQVRNAGR